MVEPWYNQKFTNHLIYTECQNIPDRKPWQSFVIYIKFFSYHGGANCYDFERSTYGMIGSLASRYDFSI